MHCTNEKHHQGNGAECSPNNEHREDRREQKPRVESPHSMHWHINKTSFKGWTLNFLYLALHVAQIYLIVTKL